MPGMKKNEAAAADIPLPRPKASEDSADANVSNKKAEIKKAYHEKRKEQRAKMANELAELKEKKKQLEEAGELPAPRRSGGGKGTKKEGREGKGAGKTTGGEQSGRNGGKGSGKGAKASVDKESKPGKGKGGKGSADKDSKKDKKKDARKNKAQQPPAKPGRYGCEYLCGFRHGDFDTVVEHELTCKNKPMPTLPTKFCPPARPGKKKQHMVKNLAAEEVKPVKRDIPDELVAQHDAMARLVDRLATGDLETFRSAAQELCKGVEDGADIPEVFLLSAVGALLPRLADKSTTIRNEAKTFAHKVVTTVKPVHIAVVVPMLFEALAHTAWQVQLGTLELFPVIAETHPDWVAALLQEILPPVSDLMAATKPEVREKAEAATVAVCHTNGNSDLDTFIPRIVSCLARPDELYDCINALAATVFVQEVRAPGLAVTEPILVRGLKLRETAIKRKVATVVDNLCKLVADPTEAAAFLPRARPAFDKVIAEITDEEAKAVLQRARDTLLQASDGAENLLDVDGLQGVAQDVLKQEGVLSTWIDPAEVCILRYVARVAHGLSTRRQFEESSWNEAIVPSLGLRIDEDKARQVTTRLRRVCERNIQVHVEDEDDDDGEDLCNCEFSLAYGAKILLANTRLHLKRGMRYGLVGPNDCGKSTLLRAIANGQLEGFPPPSELKTVYVEHDVQGIEDGTTIIDFVMMDPKVTAEGVTKEEASTILTELGFNSTKAQGGQLVTNPVQTLSGGWKMKLALARAILSKADILLCDEPTNHLDVDNVAWVTEYLKTAKKADGNDISTICVSHDSKFMDAVCSHIIHFEGRKLRTYKGNLKAFVEKVPEAASYYTLKSSRLKFVFPQPSMLEGVKSKAKHILKMNNVGYTYPGTTNPILNDVTVACTLGSRIAVIGPNGAGKSTAIKVLTGEMPPTHGTVWRHPHMRFAYVAQHAFHHLEAHLEKTPVEYILWRYSGGYDKELASQDTLKFSDEELKLMAKPISVLTETGVEKKMVLDRIVSRRKSKKSYEYEIKWVGQPMENNTWIPLERLDSLGFRKMLANADILENSKMGLSARPLTTKFVTLQLAELGLDQEFAAHVPIGQLSGGQKVKVVLSAAMWGQPHVVILDEPTNYLDRDSLAALAMAIQEFDGGVVIISHNRDFVDEVCRTLWFMVDGKLQVEGEDEIDEKIEEKLGPDTYVDAAGNTHEVKKEVEMSKAEIKKMTKAIREKIKQGEALTEDEENFAIDYDL